MIQQMRDNAATIMWVVIIAFVATIVFAWGMDLSSQSRAKNAIGKVNGKEISINYFERMVESERQKQQELAAGAEIPPYQSRMLPRQVWESEVNRILLREVFTKMHLGASPEQLFEYIKRNPPREVYNIPNFRPTAFSTLQSSFNSSTIRGHMKMRAWCCSNSIRRT